MEQYLRKKVEECLEKYLLTECEKGTLCKGYEIKPTKLPRKLKKKMKKNKQICMDVKLIQSIPYIKYNITIPPEK